MKKLLILAITAIMTGCDSFPEYEADQSIRRELFNECMAALPAGPESTVYNDWAEVVSKCDDYAYWTSRRCVKNCQ